MNEEAEKSEEPPRLYIMEYWNKSMEEWKELKVRGRNQKKNEQEVADDSNDKGIRTKTAKEIGEKTEYALKKWKDQSEPDEPISILERCAKCRRRM